MRGANPELLPDRPGIRRAAARGKVHTGELFPVILDPAMKLLPDPWLAALKAWRLQRRAGRAGKEPADMGTAFGLDSITVIDFEPTAAPGEAGPAPASGWHRRLTRRSRL